MFKSLKKHVKTKHLENSTIIELVEECVEYERQEENGALQFLDVVENEEIVEDDCENFPFLVIPNECVISS